MTTKLSFVLLALSFLQTGCGAEAQAAGPSTVPTGSASISGTFNATGAYRVVGNRLFTSASWTCSGITREYEYAVIVRKFEFGYVVWASSLGETDLRTECATGGRAGREEENLENLLYLPSLGSTYSVWRIYLPYSKPQPGIVVGEFDRIGPEFPLTAQ